MNTVFNHGRKSILGNASLATSESSVPKKLPDGDARLQAVLNSAVDGIITIDERGMIESVNPAAERLFGYTQAEMLGQNVKLLMPSPFREEHDQFLANYLATGERKIIGAGREVEGRRSDGTRFPMYLAVSELRIGARRLFTGVVHDLAELKQAETAATQLGRILEDSRNEIYVFDASNLKFVLVNRGARENLDYSMDELKDLTPVDLKPEFTTERFLRMLDQLRRRESKSIHFETVHLRKDGSRYPVEVNLQRSQVAGQEVYVAIIVDITERKNAEAERNRLLSELEGRIQDLRLLDQAIQSAGEGIVITDARRVDQSIVFVNAAFESMTGYKAEDAIGQGFALLHGKDRDQSGVKTMQAALANAERCHVVVRNYRKDGTLFWNDISLAPVRNSEGQLTHTVAVMENVTERRQTQERLVQAERLAAIGEMVTGLAHESRNALQRAQACLDMLSLDLEGQPEQLDLTNRTRTAIDDLRRLYDEVRNYAAPINLEVRDWQLPKIWRRAWDDLAIARVGRQIELVELAESTEWVCQVDNHKIQQVFRNILENAIAVCPDPGQIEIACEAAELNDCAAIQVAIRDNGSGFQGDAITQAFQPFFTTKQKGTGLGMAIVKRIVETHGGRVEIGTGRNTGGEVIITLPR